MSAFFRSDVRFSLIADGKQAAEANFAVRHQTLAGRPGTLPGPAELTGTAGKRSGADDPAAPGSRRGPSGCLCL